MPRGSSRTGEAGSQALCPGPATHCPLAANGQNAEPQPRLKITEARLDCMGPGGACAPGTTQGGYRPPGPHALPLSLLGAQALALPPDAAPPLCC